MRPAARVHEASVTGSGSPGECFRMSSSSARTHANLDGCGAVQERRGVRAAQRTVEPPLGHPGGDPPAPPRKAARARLNGRAARGARSARGHSRAHQPAGNGRSAGPSPPRSFFASFCAAPRCWGSRRSARGARERKRAAGAAPTNPRYRRGLKKVRARTEKRARARVTSSHQSALPGALQRATRQARMDIEGDVWADGEQDAFAEIAALSGA